VASDKVSASLSHDFHLASWLRTNILPVAFTGSVSCIRSKVKDPCVAPSSPIASPRAMLPGSSKVQLQLAIGTSIALSAHDTRKRVIDYLPKQGHHSAPTDITHLSPL